MAQIKRKWTAEEDAELLRRYRTGDMVSHIALALERPCGSISSRLNVLKEPRRGVIPFNKGAGRGRFKHIKTKLQDAPIPSKIGTIIRPRPGVLIHYSKGTEPTTVATPP